MTTEFEELTSITLHETEIDISKMLEDLKYVAILALVKQLQSKLSHQTELTKLYKELFEDAMKAAEDQL